MWDGAAKKCNLYRILGPGEQNANGHTEHSQLVNLNYKLFGFSSREIPECRPDKSSRAHN